MKFSSAVSGSDEISVRLLTFPFRLESVEVSPAKTWQIVSSPRRVKVSLSNILACFGTYLVVILKLVVTALWAISYEIF